MMIHVDGDTGETFWDINAVELFICWKLSVNRKDGNRDQI